MSRHADNFGQISTDRYAQLEGFERSRLPIPHTVATALYGLLNVAQLTAGLEFFVETAGNGASIYLAETTFPQELFRTKVKFSSRSIRTKVLIWPALRRKTPLFLYCPKNSKPAGNSFSQQNKLQFQLRPILCL